MPNEQTLGEDRHGLRPTVELSTPWAIHQIISGWPPMGVLFVSVPNRLPEGNVPSAEGSKCCAERADYSNGWRVQLTPG